MEKLASILVLLLKWRWPKFFRLINLLQVLCNKTFYSIIPGPQKQDFLWKPAIFISTLNDLWICFGAEDNSENPEKYLAKIWGCILKCPPSINHILIFLIEEDQIFKSNHVLWKINLNLMHSSFFHLNFSLYSSSVFFFRSGLHSTVPVFTVVSISTVVLFGLF